jgi:hypothetical protein
MKRVIIATLCCLSITGCTPLLTRGQQYAKLYEHKPTTFLVMPPINNTTNVEAKDLLYTSISKPLIEAGYYVISPYLAMDILKNESAYDAELFINASLSPFQRYFGADAVVFSVIDAWTKQGFGIRTKIRYIVKSAHSNEVLFEKSCNLYLDLSANSGNSSPFGAIANLIASAVNTAVTDHIVAARKANYYIFSDIPRGKYHPMFMQDQQESATAKELQATVR